MHKLFNRDGPVHFNNDQHNLPRAVQISLELQTQDDVQSNSSPEVRQKIKHNTTTLTTTGKGGNRLLSGCRIYTNTVVD